ncbi:MAG: hypothetical protein J6K21_00265 [Bacilli bacterium]|nr:hypothetical protein [Bacilli bacterium]
MVQIRGFFASIDNFIYSFISIVFNVIEYLAQIDLFSNETINGFTTRIYTILGIFMLFKVSFSFISYLVDPDKFMDKKTGFSKMIVNIIVVFILLISVPWVFSTLKGVQNAILEDEIISNFILGEDMTSISSENGTRKYAFKYDQACDSYSYAKTSGDYFAIALLRPFYQYSDRYLSNSGDDSIADTTEDALRKNGVLCAKIDNHEYLTPNDMLNYKVFLATKNMSAEGAYIFDVAVDAIDTTGVVTALSLNFQVRYMFFISTIVGILVLGLLISFGLDIAVRSIKMSVLQILAPIPIISYVDPDSSKHKMFTNWLKEIGKTWVSLFIRLGTLYLIIYILEILEVSNIYKNIPGKLWVWITLFYLIGALIFAKKLPSWIESMIGIKFDGGFTLNPLKKIKNEALGGKQVANATMGAIGAGVGLAGSVAAHSLAYNANRKKLNTETSKLNDIRNNRIQGIQNYRNIKAARRESIGKEMNSLAGRIEALDASGRGDTALAASLRHQYNEKASQFHNINNDEEVATARRAALSNAKVEREKYAEQQAKVDEIAKKPMMKNPIGSAAGEIARGFVGGAKHAYQADTLNVGKIVNAGLKGTDDAARKRNYREDFSIKDEFYDRKTSFARIKNESGTSSEIDKEIKKLRSEMTREMNTLNQLNNTIANLSNSVSSGKQAEAIRITSSNKDDFVSKYNSYDDYRAKNSSTSLDKDDFDKLYEAMSAWVRIQKSIDDHEKNIKKYEKMQEAQNKRGKE